MSVPLSVPLSAPQLLNRDFLEVRAKILELAACLDRFDRGEGSLDDDPRVLRIHEALRVLQDATEPDRAERVQMIFSLPYEDQWRRKWGI